MNSWWSVILKLPVLQYTLNKNMSRIRIMDRACPCRKEEESAPYPPNALSNFPITWLLGMARPDSYSLITCCFSLILCKSADREKNEDYIKFSLQKHRQKKKTTKHFLCKSTDRNRWKLHDNFSVKGQGETKSLHHIFPVKAQINRRN